MKVAIYLRLESSPYIFAMKRCNPPSTGDCRSGTSAKSIFQKIDKDFRLVHTNRMEKSNEKIKEMDDSRDQMH